MDSITICISVSNMSSIEEIIKKWQKIKDECQVQTDTHLKITVSKDILIKNNPESISNINNEIELDKTADKLIKKLNYSLSEKFNTSLNKE